MREEDGVPLRQFVPADIDADPSVEAELHARRAERVGLLVDDVLGRLEVRDSITQDAAGRGPGLEHGHAVAGRAHLLGDGQAGRPRADDRDPLSGLELGRGDREAAALVAIPVAEEGLQLADRDRLGVLADHADAFAERLLRTEAAAELGHLGGLAEDCGGIGQFAELEEGERAGNVVVDRTGDRAGRGRTLDATLGLEHGGASGVAEVDLAPVVDAVVRGLFGDVVGRDAQPLPAVNRLSGPGELRLLLALGPLPLWWFL